MFEDLPEKLVPLYQTKTVNEPILLHEGAITLHQGSAALRGTGAIHLEWLPSPRLRVSSVLEDTDTRLAIDHPVTLEFPQLGTKAEATLTSVPMLFLDGQPVQARMERLQFGDLSKCKRLRFHLPNFSFFYGLPVRYAPNSSSAERATMEHGDYRVIFDRAMPFDDALKGALPKNGGFAITHVGTVERSDGSAFSLSEIEELLRCLGYFLSFCRGCWTYPILLCAEDGAGGVIGQRWEMSHIIDHFKTVRSWLPPGQPVAAHIFQAFRGYSAAWFSRMWGESIRIATQWYIESSTGAIEKSVILMQAAFELVAWTRLVQETRTMTEAQWNDTKRLPFSAKLRLLLTSSAIPASVPAELPRLQAYCSANRIQDGPEAFTSLRNALLHPNPTKRARLAAHPDALIDSWALGLWYLDLLLLSLSAFKGTYQNRLLGGYPDKVTVKLPWA